jgi:hypothetical protein
MGWGQLLGAAAGYYFGGPAGAAAGAALGGGLDEATGGGATGAAREAAQIANASSDRALALQQRMYDESIARQQPYYQAGVNALPGYLKGIAAGGEYVRPFTMADFNADPGKDYVDEQMFKKYYAQQAARGRVDSGATRRGVLELGANLSNQRYRESLSDFLQNQEIRRNAAAGVAGYGPTSNALAAAAGERLVTGSAPLMQNQGYNTGNAMLAGERARQSAYGDIGKAFGSGGFNSLVSGFYGPGQYNQRMGVNFTDPNIYD